MKINRKSLVEKKLVVRDGWRRLVVRVDVHADDMFKLINQAKTVFADAENLAKADPSSDNLESYGNAVIQLFNIVFGVNQTERLIKFFKNNIIEMLICCMGFITDEIIPAFKSNEIISAMNKRK